MIDFNCFREGITGLAYYGKEADYWITTDSFGYVVETLNRKTYEKTSYAASTLSTAIQIIEEMEEGRTI